MVKKKRQSTTTIIENGGSLDASVKFADTETGEIVVSGGTFKAAYTREHYQRVRINLLLELIFKCRGKASWQAIIYYILINRYNGLNVVFASQGHISKQLRISKITVKRCFKFLQEQDFIKYPSRVYNAPYFFVNPQLIMQGDDKLENTLHDVYEQSNIDEDMLNRLSAVKPKLAPELKHFIQEQEGGKE